MRAYLGKSVGILLHADHLGKMQRYRDTVANFKLEKIGDHRGGN